MNKVCCINAELNGPDFRVHDYSLQDLGVEQFLNILDQYDDLNTICIWLGMTPKDNDRFSVAQLCAARAYRNTLNKI